MRRRVRENALDHTKTFSWVRAAERMEAVLEEGLREGETSASTLLRHRAAAALRTSRARLLGKGIHFDKYDLRGAYHWDAYQDDPVYRAHVDHVVALLKPAGRLPEPDGTRSESGPELLDVGCGDGLIAAHLADAGFDVTGIDIEPTAIRLARERRPDLPFRCEDVFQVKGAYDVVVASEVIEHLSDPHAFLKVLGSLFRRRALITTPERDYYSDLDPYHTTEYAYHEFVALLKPHFESVRVEASGGHLYGLVSHDVEAEWEGGG